MEIMFFVLILEKVQSFFEICGDMLFLDAHENKEAFNSYNVCLFRN